MNHAGTILSPTEIPFKNGSDTVKVDEAVDFIGVDLTLKQFCEDLHIAYPADTRKYAPRPASHSEAGLFYALMPELDENYGIRQYGYVVETEHYRYCLRCKPQEGDYDAYLWTFDRRVQEMNQAQKEKEIQTINEQIKPFDIQMHDLGDYYLALRFSFFEGEDKGYGQSAFDAYAAAKGEEPVDEHGCHARGSSYSTGQCHQRHRP